MENMLNCHKKKCQIGPKIGLLSNYTLNIWILYELQYEYLYRLNINSININHICN